ncbi:hypothetical protein AVEN_132251-1 [Araneus ventricosus]|uniref:Uncharacterized protein n=1 Tax=Araneus ventricosus TaxID=182803 RepID=A0A4Y2S5W1_ARAVE|nr:hypothetical protein AVEN_132251-1 [Araneus ventricosus]
MTFNSESVLSGFVTGRHIHLDNRATSPLWLEGDNAYCFPDASADREEGIEFYRICAFDQRYLKTDRLMNVLAKNSALIGLEVGGFPGFPPTEHKCGSVSPEIHPGSVPILHIYVLS